MDLNQIKLCKSEWESTEKPVDENTKSVLLLIKQGYHDVNKRYNTNQSLFSFLKVEYSEKMEEYIYLKFLHTKMHLIEVELMKIIPSYQLYCIKNNNKPNSSDKIRLERFNIETLANMDIYENVLLNHAEKMVHYIDNHNPVMFHFHYYTLYKLIRNHIVHINKHVSTCIHNILRLLEERIQKHIIIEHCVDFIEKNTDLLKYSDLVLYEHQKNIFTIAKQSTPKLILYMAPTGTGKTMTPIALAQNNRIIFVCAARHVGLALARAAISVDIKLAFAFGCSSADDIRLHYFAAKEYQKNKRSGGICKVDNSIGDNVEIMICDIKSYLPAMYYMLAFFPATQIITYWDEPTITMDYDTHEFHETIQRNWQENRIPNMVLSSATLPKEHELRDTISDFMIKFPDAIIHNIVSHDCKKSISIVNKDGYVVLPHYLSRHYTEMKEVANHCSDYLTLLRYFDLKEVAEFITYMNKHHYAELDHNFDSLSSITMTNIKKYYIELLQQMTEPVWHIVYSYFDQRRSPRILENTAVDVKGNKIHKIHSLGPGGVVVHQKMHAGAPLTRMASEQVVAHNPLLTQTHNPLLTQTQLGTSGAYVSTKDAYTLTDGPTIFISNDVEKIARFCVQQANIPTAIMDDLMKKIEYNNVINQQIHNLEKEMDVMKESIEQKAKNDVNGYHGGKNVHGRSKSNKDPKKLSRDISDDLMQKGGLGKMTEQINSLRSMIKHAYLNDVFVPNKRPHLEKWAPTPDAITNAFSSSIDEQVVADIMALNGVDTLWKIMLMMGIGGFIRHENITYTEIMKQLAEQQKLYMIIATDDYIWGTNYQFCHGYLSKDLKLTQEKIIQAMGRIGRGNIQQTYTVRFRDDSQLSKLFTSHTEKPEVANMNKLFSSQK